MEIILVMTVLVIVAAISIPTLSSMLRGSNLDAAKDAVQAELTRARNKALEQRVPFKFAVKLNTGSYRIAPDDDNFWGGTGSTVGGDWDDDAALDNLVIEGTLPDKICFCSPDGVNKIGGSAEWLPLATFLADGTALEDVQITLGTEGTQPVVITLRAGTGAISAASFKVVGSTH
jgi:type II secretory pathway pseudopilin PulG